MRPTRKPTLALRITGLFALGALLVSVVVAVSASWFTMRLLVSEQQKAALRQTYINAAIAKTRLANPRRDVPAIVDDLTASTSTQKIIYASDRWYSSSLLISRDALPDRIRSEALAGRPVWEWATIGGDARIVVGMPLPAVHSAYFQVFDEASLGRTASILRMVLIAAAAATTAAGGLLGWAASRRLTAPLRTVTRAARRIASGNLETRLPDEHDRDLSQLVGSFNAMVDALQDRAERDAQFAADVSHELRSPLTTLSTSFGVLQARRDELSPRGRDALQLVSTELARFERLVQDLLDISHADARTGLDDAEPTRISQLILNLLERAEYQGVRVTFDGDALDAVVAGDKRRLAQAFRNILDNGATYAGGVTEISAHTDGDRLVIYLDDAGPGIAAEERERIFERFTRSRSGARASHSGTGLGLALVQRHVRAHEGSVRVGDAPGGGARFEIHLPRIYP